MTTPKAGSQFHFLHSGFTFSTDTTLSGSGQMSRRGQTVTVTENLISASTDRTGFSWLELIDDPEAQEARWGHHMFAPGVAPEGVTPWSERGTVEAELERAARMRVAMHIVDDQKRAEAIRAVKREFGEQHTSSVLAQYDGGSGR